MKLVVFGLSLSSSWGNGHATTYRALLSAFARRGHEVVFYEWDAPWYRGAHRDLPAPSWCRLVLYPDWGAVRAAALAEAAEADAVLVGSYVRGGPAILDDLFHADVDVHFYDIDTPVTVQLLRSGNTEWLRRDQVPRFLTYFSFTGGPFLEDVLEAELGARRAVPLYCSVDRAHYRPVAADPRFESDLAYLGTYAEDRQRGLERFLLEPGRRDPRLALVVAGPRYPDPGMWPAGVRHVEHVAPPDHPAFYSSARWQLNLTRADMRSAGWSPSVRLFEAAACAAPLLSDAWPGIEDFFRPGQEILLPRTTEDVLHILRDVDDEARRALGAAGRARVLALHTSEHRAAQLEAALQPPVHPSGPGAHAPPAAARGP